MKPIRFIKFFTAMLFFVWGGATCSSDDSSNPPPPGAITITIPSGAIGLGSAAYGDNPLHVALGGSVVWKNSDSMSHTATSDTGMWDTGGIAGGATSSATTFDSEGTFPYHCTIHGAIAMSGVIVVP